MIGVDGNVAADQVNAGNRVAVASAFEREADAGAGNIGAVYEQLSSAV